MTAPNLYALLASSAQRHAERDAIVDGNLRSTYAELLDEVERCAAWLESLGVSAGDRVGLCMRKRQQEIVITFAVARLGAVFVNVHPQSPARHVALVANDCTARVLVIGSSLSKPIAAALAAVAHQPAVVELADVSPDPPPWADVPASALRASAPDATALGALLYTSGSTGKPRGVMHSQGNLVAFAINVASYLKVTADDRILALLPVSFGYGLSQVITPLSAGACVFLQRNGFASEVVKAIQAHAITGFAAVPVVWGQLLTFLNAQPTALESLRYVTNAGGGLSQDAARALRRSLPRADIVLMYGTTETLRSTYLPPELFERYPGALGREIPNVRVFVSKPDGQLAGPGESGELVHCGQQVGQGYWNDPASTRARFHSSPEIERAVGSVPTFFTGDIVRIDETGMLWFVSRADWMVKSGGFRFSTAEVEECIRGSGVVEDVVVIVRDDAHLGQAVEAFVRPSVGFDLAQLQVHCRRELATYMMPARFHTHVDPFPTTPNGKLDRLALRALLPQ